MDFSQPYNRTDFVNFLRRDFLPDDFEQTNKNVPFRVHMNFASTATKLGVCRSLDLVVYEIKHTSHNDARVGLSKDAFRMLAGERQSRALVIFVPEDTNANYRFSLIEISLTIGENDSNVTRTYSNPRRYSYCLGNGIACYTPNKYLNKLGKVTDVKDLFERFSVEVLTKDFYKELSNWYFWALDNVQFPNIIQNPTEDKKYNPEAVIRLITRLIFVWFIKQKHLIPEEFFDQNFISERLLKDFHPNLCSGLFMYKSLESKYYKAILQNLFFAMLNSPISVNGSNQLERKFKENRGQGGDDKLMRYKSLFKDSNLFLDLANSSVPFLNGGLFDCLDVKPNVYIDGFSDREEVQKKLVVPDFLFFGEDKNRKVDLSKHFGDKKMSEVQTIGIIDILKRYNFTIEENTPFDKEVSLDPELLGKVFENLLAAYNPETELQARKQTGSFYTPREIVQYMVDESLVTHLKRTVGEELEPEYRKLLSCSDDELCLTDDEKQNIINSLYNCKVLDPACGSGAFPVGMLQQMVHILSQIDPNNERWKDIILKDALAETESVFKDEINSEKEQRINDISRSFDNAISYPNYARKLYLIEKCLFGVDIQPIAIQISKLRFFISLVVDQVTNNNPLDNFGIRPLPNLEANFVAANTLISLNKSTDSIGRTPDIIFIENQLKEANHKIFYAKTSKTKNRWRNKFSELKEQLKINLRRNGFITDEGLNQLDTWYPFNQNTSASFFDAEWMFGVKDGFDIVIANPPYIDSETMSNTQPEMRNIYKKLYSTARGNWDMFVIFIEIGISLLKDHGVFSYIIPNKVIAAKYAAACRRLLSENNLIVIRDYGNVHVFDAAVYPCVLLLKREDSDSIKIFQTMEDLVNTSRSVEITSDIFKKDLFWDKYFIEPNELDVILRISRFPALRSFNVDITGASTVSEAYEIKKVLCELQSEINEPYFKFINTGTIDKYKSLWGLKKTQYIKGAYQYPIILSSSLKRINHNRFVQACTQKIIIAGMSSSIEAILDNGEILAGKSTSIVRGEEHILKAILGIINSKLIDYWLRINYNSLKMAGGYINVGVNEISSLPVNAASINNSTLITMVNQVMESPESFELMKEIDHIVYHLYELTYDEVLVIDPETPITREEYESFN